MSNNLWREKKHGRAAPTISVKASESELVELVHDEKLKKTQFVIWKDGDWKKADFFDLDGKKLIPYSPDNNLIQHKVILLPSQPEEYGTVERLSDAIKEFIHRYVDVMPIFEDIATSYVLLSWVYDCFDELPYLRFRGDPGSGKTRCLMTLGSICYKPIFASGASTISPIFRLLDTVRGTLILDEGDFRFSDEKAEFIKILNNGNAKGFPVLRSELVNKQEFNPRAYYVFGPKVLATRGYFRDHALETRCLTEEMGQRRMREEIPINLPDKFQSEALTLRNMLLLYRFRFLSGLVDEPSPVNFHATNRTLEPRMKQLLQPFLRVTPSAHVRESIITFAETYQRELQTERGMETEAQVVETLIELARSQPAKIAIGELTRVFAERFADDYERKITPKWLGSIVRKKLGLKTFKSVGVFIIPNKELSKLKHLASKYGIDLQREESDVVESET